ncbi:Multiple epidermal growth factor-like domains protein 8 [Thoreauomyces humboldtii]|nr:Multiple epidermal growth factor-like domains protein 8 [Thoreauomyces humboldtii]
MSPQPFRSLLLISAFVVVSCLRRQHNATTPLSLSASATPQQELSNFPSFPSVTGSSGYCSNLVTINGVSEGYIVSNYGGQVNYIDNSECQWIIDAPEGSVVELSFLYFHTECGWDWLTIYDGSYDASVDMTAPAQIATLCGNRNDTADVVVSSGSSMTLIFTSDSAVNSVGFKGLFKVIGPTSVCSTNADCNGFTCIGGACQCGSYHRGSFCQFGTTGYASFTPRMLHSNIFDPDTETMYIIGGRNAALAPLDDMLAYRYTTQSWTKSKLDQGGTGPGPRIAHSTWWFDGSLILYGGISSGQPMTDVWAYSSGRWVQYQASGDGIPPGTAGYAATLVEGSQKFDIYVVGGIDLSDEFSRSLFRYSSDLQTWKELSPIPIRMTGANLVYHPTTRMLYLLGGLRYTDMDMTGGLPSYKYSIEADMWYLGPLQDPPLATYATADYIGSDALAIHGGIRPLLKPDMIDDTCFLSQTTVLDLACDTFGFVNTVADPFARRKGHGMFQTSTGLVVTGGNNGYLLNDNATIPISVLSATLPPQPLRDSCAANNCCLYTGNTMTNGPRTVPNCPGTTTKMNTMSSECPIRLDSLETDGPIVSGSVEIGQSDCYKLFIDEPDRDIHFLAAAVDSSITLNLTLTSVHPHVSTTSGEITISVYDQTHMSATYVVCVTYPAVPLPLHNKRSPSSTTNTAQSAPYQIRIQTTAGYGNTGDGGDGSPSTGMTIDAQDIATFIVVFIASILASLVATYIARRLRDRIYLVRLMRAGQVMVLPKEPPTLFEVLLDLDGSATKSHKGSAAKGKSEIGGGRRLENIIRTAEAHDLMMDDSSEDIGEIVLGRSEIFHEGPGRNHSPRLSSPLAIHTLPVQPSDPSSGPSTPAVAISYMILFPGTAPPLSRMQIGTAVYRDNTTASALNRAAERSEFESSAKSGSGRSWTPGFVRFAWQYLVDIWRVERLLGHG